MNAPHGGNIEEIARAFGIERGSIIDFSANINPLGISPMAREAIKRAIDSVENYPDNEYYELVRALAKYHGMAPENILIGNGSTEFIYLIPRLFRPKKGIIIVPAFSEYENSLKQSGCHTDNFILNEEDDFRLDINRLLFRLKEGCDTLWIGNPGNPTGRLIPRKDMIKILSEAKRKGILCVVDEAFIDFCEDESIKSEVAEYDNLIVLRSMTKFFSLPGLRVGYIFGSRCLIEEIKSYKPPWTVNRLGEAAAVASLKDEDYKERSLNIVETERKFLYKGFKSFSFLKTYPADANYIFLRLNGEIRSEEVQKRLRKKDGILVRNCCNYRGLEGEFIRVAVRKRSENMLLLEALKRACEA